MNKRLILYLGNYRINTFRFNVPHWDMKSTEAIETFLNRKKRARFIGAKRREKIDTFGKHSKPPPVTLSKAKEHTLSGAMAANLQAIIAPDLNQTQIATKCVIRQPYAKNSRCVSSWIHSIDNDDSTHPWSDQRHELSSSLYDPVGQGHPLPWYLFCDPAGQWIKSLQSFLI